MQDQEEVETNTFTVLQMSDDGPFGAILENEARDFVFCTIHTHSHTLALTHSHTCTHNAHVISSAALPAGSWCLFLGSVAERTPPLRTSLPCTWPSH